MFARYALLIYGSTLLLAWQARHCLGQVPPGDDAAVISGSESVDQRPALQAEDGQRVEELSRQITSLREQAAYEEAVAHAEEVLVIRRRSQGADWWETRDAERVAATLRRISAMPAADQARLAEAERNHAVVARLYGEARYGEALDLTQQQLGVTEAILGPEHPQTLDLHNNEALLLQLRGDLPGAEPIFRRTVAQQRRVLGNTHPQTLNTMYNLAMLLRDTGQYAEAEQLLRPILADYRRIRGSHDAYTFLVQSQLAGVLQLDGKYRDAMALYQETLRGERERLGESHPQTVMTMGDLATLLLRQGQLAKAEVVAREVLQHCRQTLGDEHHESLLAMNRLAAILSEQHKTVEAEDLLRQALSVAIHLHGPEHVFVCRLMHNLADTLVKQRQFAEALALERDSLKGKRRVLGTAHPEVADSLYTLARLYLAQGKFEKARSTMQQVVDLDLRTYGKTHPFTAQSMDMLAEILGKQGDYGQAETLARQALAMRQGPLGGWNPDRVRSLSMLGLLKYYQGQYVDAETAFARAAKDYDSGRSMASFTPIGRAIAHGSGSPFPVLAVCQARNGKPAEAWASLEASFARGLLDGVSRRQARPLTSAEQSLEQDLASALSHYDERLAALSTPRENESQGNLAADLRKQREAVRSRLLRFEQDMQDKYGVAAGQIYSLSNIQERLQVDSALIAWADIRGNAHAVDPGGDHWGCVIRRTGRPRWIRLGGSGSNGTWTKDDNTLPRRLRERLADPRQSRRAGAAPLASALYQQRLAPLVPHLQGVEQLIVLPAGWIAGVPVDVLTDDYIISYAPSATMYAWLRDKATAASARGRSPRLLAVGDPQFPQPVTRHVYPALPGTRREVAAIERILRAGSGAGGNVSVLLGADATEEHLQALADAGTLGEFSYLHFATHATLDDRVAMRSALVLADDPRAYTLDDFLVGHSIYDGRLTAAQIVRGWHLDADLVTLSACDTALGRTVGGEGFLGFSQALFVAGARSLILSLWKVDDTAATLLMTRFYENLLGHYVESRWVYAPGEPMPKAAALHEAQRWLRKLPEIDARRVCATLGIPDSSVIRGGPPLSPGNTVDRARRTAEHRPFAHAYYWAAFILVGDSG